METSSVLSNQWSRMCTCLNPIWTNWENTSSSAFLTKMQSSVITDLKSTVRAQQDHTSLQVISNLDKNDTMNFKFWQFCIHWFNFLIYRPWDTYYSILWLCGHSLQYYWLQLLLVIFTPVKKYFINKWKNSSTKEHFSSFFSRQIFQIPCAPVSYNVSRHCWSGQERFPGASRLRSSHTVLQFIEFFFNYLIPLHSIQGRDNVLSWEG